MPYQRAGIGGDTTFCLKIHVRIEPGSRLRAAVAERLVPCVGIYDVFSASVAARRFDALFVSGFGFAASHYGMPDVGFIAWPDVLAFVRRLRSVLPRHHLLVDIDDGYVDVDVACHVVRVLRGREPSAPLDPESVCAPGENGYVWLNTPALMREYWRRDDLTEAAVSHGWFLTGDIGSLDARGFLVLSGRERDEINKGGAKIYPGDVDAVVEQFAAVTDVCTFAVDDALYGQNVGMAVCLRDTADDTLRGLHRWMTERLAEPKMPVKWFVLDEIPRTSRGKVNRDLVKNACTSATPLDLTRVLKEQGS